MGVVITGIGMICSLGGSRSRVFESILAARPRMGPVRAFDAEGYGLSDCVVAEIPECEFEAALGAVRERVEKPRRLTRFQTLVLAAAAEAIEDARLNPHTDADARRAGIVLGTMYGGAVETERTTAAVLEGRRPRISDSISRRAGIALQMLAGGLGMGGPMFVVDSACASGASSVSAACRLIESGASSWCLAGGAEAAIVPTILGVLHSTGVLSTGHSGAPDGASRPFDRTRDGFVPAEGACLMVLESADRARSRGVPPYARIAARSEMTDAFHPTDLSSAFAERVMRDALTSADIVPAELAWVNAHATSTRQGDRQEAEAIHRMLGGRSVPTCAPKSMTGHLLGAAGAFEIALSALSIREGVIPPTANLEDPDPDCPVRCLPEAERAEVACVLSSSFGFGGSGCSVVVARPEER